MLARDRKLSKNKEMISKTIAAFEKEKKYSGHIMLDVDPL
jgi:hypothetical protein